MHACARKMPSCCVRQGCILSPLLFYLYLDDIARILDSQIAETDPIILPNGLPFSCLFFAHNLVLISKSVQGLYKQINILNEYSNKWLLKINLKKTKALIHQKQNRKSTGDKCTFFLNANSISTNKLQVSSILEEPKLVNSKLPK